MKRIVKIFVALLVLVLLLGVSGLLVLRTEWFREKLRQRAVSELEKATGGRVEVARIHFDARRWHGRLEGLTIHGLESPGQSPLFHAAALEVDLKVVSFLKRQVDVARLRLESPEIHVTVAPDGSTNIPTPQERRTPGRALTEDLLDLAAGRFELDGGALWWNDRRYAFEVALSDLKTRVRLERPNRYAGRLEAGRTVVSSPPQTPEIQGVAADFQLLRDRVEIAGLVARTALSEWKSRGTITELSRPRWRFDYEAAVDAREVAAIVPLPELKRGRIQLRGSFDSGGSQWKAGGKVSASDVAAAGKEFRMANVSLRGGYYLDPEELRVEGLEVRLLGGAWKGRLTADRRRQPIQASLQGRVEGIRLEAATEAVSTPSRPFARLGWTAAISGPLDLQATFPVSQRALSLTMELAFQRPGELGELTPIEGLLRAAYQGRASEIQLLEARLSTAATSIAASGRLSTAGSSDLQFRAQTARLEDVTGPAAAFSGEKLNLPVSLAGKAVMQGRVSGTVEQPEVDAAMDVSRFAYAGREWDSFTGRVQWSRQRLRLIGGRLMKDKTAVNANLTASLENGRLTGRSPVEAEVSVRDTQVQDLAALAGQKAPLTGAVTAALKLQGTQKDPRGAGRLEIRRGTAWGEPFDTLRAAVAFEAGEVRLNNVQVSKAKNSVTGALAFHPQRRSFRFDARGENLSLADMQALSKAGRKVAGNAYLQMAGSGRLGSVDTTLDEIALEGDLRIRKISLDGRPLGDLTATARNDGGKLRLQVQSDFAGSQIAADGEVLMRDRFPIQGRAEFRNLDVSSALRIAGMADWPAQISADGSVVVMGEGRDPKTLTATGDLTRLQVDWPETPTTRSVRTLKNAEPVKWRIANQRVALESFHLVGEGSDVRSSGWAELGGAGALNLGVRGTLTLGVLSAWRPGVEVGGSSILNAAITGTRERPEVRGTFSIRDGSITSEDLPVTLSNANGVITFTRQHATVQQLRAEVGGGEVRISGDADFIGRTLTYQLRAEARQVRLRRPRGLTTVMEGVLNFNGTNQRSHLSGDIRITHAGTRATLDFGALLEALKQPARVPSRNDWLQGLQLNVSVVTAPDIRFDSPLARNLQADANLRLQGNALNPALLGRVNITQGEFEFQGTRYTINRGDITFANPFRIDPILNLDLETRVSVYDITLTLAGSIQKLNVSYRSDPPLPVNEVITLLAVGRAPTIDPTLAAQQTSQARSLAQIGASSLVGQVIAKPSGRLQRFFGVSRLKLDPELSGPEGNPNARVTLEQQVGKDITFTYVYNLASAQEQIIRVQWAISKQLSLIAVRDQNGVFGIDFLYKKRYR